MRNIAAPTENIGGICFGAGSMLLFYLFFKSRYIPKALSALGIVAALLWTSLYFANLIFPEHHTLFRYICFPPMALADLGTGIYLVLFSISIDPEFQQEEQRAAMTLQRDLIRQLD